MSQGRRRRSRRCATQDSSPPPDYAAVAESEKTATGLRLHVADGAKPAGVHGTAHRGDDRGGGNCATGARQILQPAERWTEGAIECARRRSAQAQLGKESRSNARARLRFCARFPAEKPDRAARTEGAAAD